MNIFRSETMQYFKIIIPKTNAVRILSAVETIGNIHFIDRSEHDLKAKNYFNESSKRCTELLFHLKQLEEKISESEMRIKKVKSVEKFYDRLEHLSHSTKDSDEKIFADLESELEQIFTKINETGHYMSDIDTTIHVVKRNLGFYNLIRKVVPVDSLE